MSKINLVYKTFPHLGSPRFGTTRLEETLKDLGLLNYAYDTSSGGQINKDELQRYPILYMRGLIEGMMPYIEAGGNQFKAVFQSESFYTRHGIIDSPIIRTREKLFDMIFTVADSDLNTYSIPTVHCLPWADSRDFYPTKPLTTDISLLFVGNKDGREDFLAQDRLNLIKVVNTDRYNELMGDHLFILNPPGRYYNGVCGRLWEILACQRVCFQYHNPDTMDKTLEDFIDGIDIVLFSSMQELYNKYNYYKKNINKAWAIAYNGYQKYLDFHTQDIRAKFLAETILDKVMAYEYI